ncbi:hypothetical protein BKA70DRAFT_1202287 [Coprinopsis sp. MPI-PUGE-AT-0042]|nr:hypothetical protein BKA70DRAFT_1202287 [Coprinopsis sp. MPI-PUGE-AT-0042]
MACLAPAAPPVTSSSALKENVIDLTKLEIRPTTSVAEVTETVLATNEEKPSPVIPVVKLQVDTISEDLAARLASSLLAMVLFLKNQVPLPVPQLVRITGKNSSPKAAKQRIELLSAYDTLTSHLTTTFSALAMALSEAREKDKKEPPSSHHRAYLAILLGPSLGTAKAKVFLGVDHLGLDVNRAAGIPTKPEIGDDRSSESNGNDLETTSEEEEEESEEGETEESEEDEDEEGPSTSESEDEGEDDDEAQESDLEKDPEEAPKTRRHILQSPPPKPDARQPTATSPPNVSYAEEQRFLQNADRLLSRTLASADAEGYGLASDMSTTQTHILIRAPRNFWHPAWIPRQNVTSTLDNGLKAFFAESLLDSTSSPPPPKNSKKQRTEGVWLTSKHGMNLDSSPLTLNDNEEDDMIWWSWDGKLVGFSDW